MRVVLATNNAKKLAELRRLVAEQQLDLTVLGLADVPTLLRVHGMLASLICAAACFHIWRKS